MESENQIVLSDFEENLDEFVNSDSSFLNESVSSDEILDDWCEIDREPALEDFNEVPGLNVTLEDNSSIMNYVILFLGDDFFQLLQECSQEYHDQNVERMQTCDKEVNWFDLSGQELKKFMGLILRMADSPRKPIKKFWSVDDYHHQTIFGKTNSGLPANLRTVIPKGENRFSRKGDILIHI